MSDRHSDPTPSTHRSLTERQQEVLRLMMAGLTNKEIAERTATTEASVKHHVQVIKAVMGVKSRLQVALNGRAYLPEWEGKDLP
jgi:DNA-binding NarL/FixJ family response regulator